MRLYVLVKSPSDVLKKIANFVSAVYTLCWCMIQMNPETRCCSKNSQNILKFAVNYLKLFFLIVKPVVQRNAYFAHSENVLNVVIDNKKSCLESLGREEF